MEKVISFHKKFDLKLELDLEEFENEIDWIARILEIYLARRHPITKDLERESPVWKKTFEILKLLIFDKMDINHLVKLEDYHLLVDKKVFLGQEEIYQMVLLSE